MKIHFKKIMSAISIFLVGGRSGDDKYFYGWPTMCLKK